MSKYRNVRTTIDGETFDSKLEAQRYQELKLLEKAGEVRDIQRQVVFPLMVGETRVAKYVADFVYLEHVEYERWQVVREDVKSEPTRKKESYRIKFRWMAALGTPIREYVRTRR